jgi:acetyl-CoA carboxylase carboxyl transferase subunit alpha
MAIPYTLEFEKPLTEIEAQIEALETARAGASAVGPGAVEARPAGHGSAATTESATPETGIEAEIAGLRTQHFRALKKIYSQLNAWETVRVARHPLRPQLRDYISLLVKDFCELHGDRRFGDDAAIVTGFGRIGSVKCLIVGHHKGRDTNEKLACHFGCAHPEGYRKALAKMKLAEKFGLPIVTIVDTPGAYPGLGAEQRGQAEAIALNMREMAKLKTPIVTVVIGEGGSGGALGIAVADRVAMLEHAYYSVISPEGCAAILWKQATPETNAAAAAALCLTAKDNKRLGVIDEVIAEPVGGAHRDRAAAAEALEKWITAELASLRRLKPASLPERRYKRFRALGEYTEVEPAAAAPGDAGPDTEAGAEPDQAARAEGGAEGVVDPAAKASQGS